MEDNDNIVYQLGPNVQECSVLSLKANSRLMKDLQSPDIDAWIEFTSTTSARIIIGKDEYELSFCDTKPTDAYSQDDYFDEMALLGEVQGRLQVTGSNVVVAGEKLPEEPLPKKREITILEIGAGMPSREANKRPKLVHAVSGGMSSTPLQSQSQPKRKSLSTFVPEPAMPIQAQPSFDLTTSVLLLGNVPVELAASDVLGSLFSGLSIAAMYVCVHSTTSVNLGSSQPSAETAASTLCCVDPSSTVDLYVEFSFIGGAELGMIRDGEELSYRSVNTSTTEASSASGGKPSFTRQAVTPRLQPVEPQLATWVRSVGVKVYTSGTSSSAISGSTSGSGVAQPGFPTTTPIKKYIEMICDSLHAASPMKYSSFNKFNRTPTGPTHALSEVLCNPVSLAKHWQDVAVQWVLPPGTIDTFSLDDRQKVRINKDTEYMLSNHAVSDILFAHLFDPHGQTEAALLSCAQGGEEVCAEGLYDIQDDQQFQKYDTLVEEADSQVRHYSTLWCVFSCIATNKDTAVANVSVKGTAEGAKSSAVVGNNDMRTSKYVHELISARLALYKVLYKGAWSLSTTHSVFM